MKSVPQYIRIINYYTELIESGKMTDGTQMPTEETIGELFGVSRITVRQALDGLVQGGYIYKLQGRGSFVSSKKADMQLDHLIGFSDEMRNLGKIPSTKLIDVAITAVNETVAKALMIESTQKIYRIIRLRYADGMPVALERVNMPFARFAGLENKDLAQSLYKLLGEEYGCQASKAVQRIWADGADNATAKLLEIKAGAPVLVITRTTYENDGMPFEYVESTYLGNKYVFNATLNR